jgi:hypothetical protein
VESLCGELYGKLYTTSSFDNGAVQKPHMH